MFYNSILESYSELNAEGKIEDPWPELELDFVDEIMKYDLNEQNTDGNLKDVRSKRGNFINIAKNNDVIDVIFE